MSIEKLILFELHAEPSVIRFKEKALTRSINWTGPAIERVTSTAGILGWDDYERGFCQCSWFYSPRLNLKLVQVGTQTAFRCHKPWQTKESFFYRFHPALRRNSVVERLTMSSVKYDDDKLAATTAYFNSGAVSMFQITSRFQNQSKVFSSG